jgi:hypothetical protein
VKTEIDNVSGKKIQKKRSKKGGPSRLGKKHFDEFASVEIFNGQFYMTPRDFMDCIVHEAPRPRIKRRVGHANSLKHITQPFKPKLLLLYTL